MEIKVRKMGINLEEMVNTQYAVHKPKKKRIYIGDERDLLKDAFDFFNSEGDKSINQIFWMIVIPHMVRNNSLYKFDITNLDEAIKDCENYITN